MTPPVVVAIGEALYDHVPGGRVLGGAPLNFAIHLKRLLGGRATVALVSRVGDDEPGTRMLDHLRARGVDTRGVQRDPARPTGRALVSADARGEPVFDLPRGVAYDAIEADSATLALVANADAIHFSTLAQREPASRAAIQQLAAAARCPLRVFDVNLRQGHVVPQAVEWGFAHADVLKINDEELGRVASVLGWRGRPDPDATLERLCAASSMHTIALTRGPRGTVLHHRGQRIELTPDEAPRFERHPLADAVGAGDACTAGLVAGLITGLDPRATLRLSSACGAYVASRPGPTPELPASILALAP